MDIINIKVGDKKYTVKVAKTDSEKEQGLKNIESLPENEGMLFLSEDEDLGIWMRDTLIPLDIVFITDDLEVKRVFKGKPETDDIMFEEGCQYVLEVNANSGIIKGDDVEFLSNSKTKLDKMYVLNDDGSPQMELSGGERIFSRPNTKVLIKFAKKASFTGKESDYKALGKRVFKFLEVQDKNEPEFVKSKNNEDYES